MIDMLAPVYPVFGRPQYYSELIVRDELEFITADLKDMRKEIAGKIDAYVAWWKYENKKIAALNLVGHYPGEIIPVLRNQPGCREENVVIEYVRFTNNKYKRSKYGQKINLRKPHKDSLKMERFLPESTLKKITQGRQWEFESLLELEKEIRIFRIAYATYYKHMCLLVNAIKQLEKEKAKDNQLVTEEF